MKRRERHARQAEERFEKMIVVMENVSVLLKDVTKQVERIGTSLLRDDPIEFTEQILQLETNQYTREMMRALTPIVVRKR